MTSFQEAWDIRLANTSDSDGLTLLYEFAEHQRAVMSLALLFTRQLISRAKEHDVTKLDDEEFNLLKTIVNKKADYGTRAYVENLVTIRPAVEHHYANNRHHPEHFPDGIAGMNLLDFVEMFCDICAAAQQRNSDKMLDLDKFCKKYNIEPAMRSILANTATHFGVKTK